jgi:hypothetical protein
LTRDLTQWRRPDPKPSHPTKLSWCCNLAAYWFFLCLLSAASPHLFPWLPRR